MLSAFFRVVIALLRLAADVVLLREREKGGLIRKSLAHLGLYCRNRSVRRTRAPRQDENERDLSVVDTNARQRRVEEALRTPPPSLLHYLVLLASQTSTEINVVGLR